MYSEKLSVIIPTRNRQKYAIECIKTILKIGKGEFEIVVQDNSDDQSLESQIKDLNDSRVVYSYSSENLSFCSNFEKAIDLSTGDYLVMIGDDDCVTSALFSLIPIIREKGIKSVIFPTETIYKWPNSVNNGTGTITIRKTKIKCKVLYTKKAFKKMLGNGNFDYQKYNFPKIYHGVIKRSCLDDAKNKTGHYFSGLTPDIYSAISLSFVVDKILFVNYQFTLPGICPRSGSADSVNGRHTGELKDAPHFRGNDNYAWNGKIPGVYSVQTIWAETALKAMSDNGVDVIFKKKQYRKFLIKTLVVCPQFLDVFVNDYQEKYQGKKSFIRCSFKIQAKWFKLVKFIRKCWAFLLQLCIGRKTINDIDDIYGAVEIMQKELNNNRVNKAISKIKW